MDIRVIKSIGNDRYPERLFPDIKCSKTDPVHANGSFLNNKSAKFFGETELKFPTATFVDPFDAGACCIHMSLNNMPVEPVCQQKTTFYVDNGAFCPVPEIGFFKRFFDSGYPVLVPPDLPAS